MGNKKYTVYRLDYRPRNEYYPCDSPLPVRQQGIGGSYVAFDYNRTGVSVPNYASKIKRGESATSPMTLDLVYTGFTPPKLQVKYTNKLCPYNYGKQPLNQHGGVSSVSQLQKQWPPDAIPTDLEVTADSIAAIQIRKKIRALTQSYEGLTFLGELREALSMIRSPVRSLRLKTDLFLREVRSKHELGKRMPSWPQVLADTWLEFSFGAKPLMGDITSAANAAIDIKSDAIRRVVGIGEAERTRNDPDYTSGVLGLPIVVSYENRMIWKAGVMYRAGVRTSCNASQGSLERIVDAGGFDLANVVPTAWELVPWSFLVDYFVSVGDTLSAHWTSTSNFVWGQRTVKLDRTRDICNGHISSISGMSLLGPYETARFVYKKIRYVRSSSTLPLPGFVFKMPPIDSMKWLNIGALVTASPLFRKTISRIGTG